MLQGSCGGRVASTPFLLSACKCVYVRVEGLHTNIRSKVFVLDTVRCQTERTVRGGVYRAHPLTPSTWKENGEGCMMLGEANLTHELTKSLQHGCSVLGLSSYVTKFNPPSYMSAAEDTMPSTGDIYCQRDTPFLVTLLPPP